MKISIITVCFNAENTIEDTFLSTFNQTHKDIELIVIDGKSTDKTVEIIEKYKDKIHYFVSEPDKGIYDAMNKGITAANSYYLIFMNAGDSFYDDMVLENVEQALTNNPKTKFLFGDADYISKQASQIVTFGSIKNEFSLILDNICHQSIFYHRSLFEKFGLFSEDFKIYADWDFNIKCLVENKVPALYLAIPICKFYLSGISSNPSNEKICKLEKKLLIKKYYKKYKFLLFTTNFLRKRFGFLYKLFLKKLIDLIAYLSHKKLNISNY